MGAPLRILQVYPKDDYFTGAAIQLRELTTGLRHRGHEVVVATRPSETWASKLGEAGGPPPPPPRRARRALPPPPRPGAAVVAVGESTKRGPPARGVPAERSTSSPPGRTPPAPPRRWTAGG